MADSPASSSSYVLEGARASALKLGLIDEAAWAAGIAALERAALAQGTFCYTFFKATALTP